MSNYDDRQSGSHSRIDEGGGALGTFFDFDFPEPTEEEKRNAMLYVCEKSEDVDDARLLLEALGLHGGAAPKQHGKGECPKCFQKMTARYVKKHLELGRCKGRAA